jgi:NTE family protein
MKKPLISLTLAISLLAASPLAEITSAAGPKRPSIGLALGSGGAGGLAHIAMLQVFDDLEIKPDRITGTSIGAIIGSLYAAGLSAGKIKDLFDDFGGSNLDALSRLMSPNSELTLRDLLKIDIANGGLFDSSGFLDFLAGKIDARSFEDLAIPLEIVATDYWSGDAIVFKEGDLFKAIKASMAVPGLFSPVSLDDQLLVDGGMSNPLPFDLLTGNYDVVVAIDVTGPRTAQKSDEVDLTDLVFSAFEIMQQSIIKERIRAGEPDIYIQPDTNDVRLLHFNRIEDILERAKPAAEKLKKELASAIDSLSEN